MQDIDEIHVQPLGGVVASAHTHDGRVIRVCGEKPFREWKISEELHKWMKWEVNKNRF
jgi:hypothetical protein